MPKTILITGTSTGIGHAAALQFANAGWKVYAASRHPEKLTFDHPSTRSARSGQVPGITPLALDVNDLGSIRAAFATMSKESDTLDAVVNNAGFGFLMPFEDTPRETIDAIFRANVIGLMDVSREAVKMMRPQGHGVIVNISSILGLIGTPFYTVYCASKWAVEGFSESLLHEIAEFGLRVKIIEPSGTRTEFHMQAYDHEALPVTDVYRERFDTKRAKRFSSQKSYASPELIAALIEQAVNDPSLRLRYGVREVHSVSWLQRLLGRDAAWKVLYRRAHPKRV